VTSRALVFARQGRGGLVRDAVGVAAVVAASCAAAGAAVALAIPDDFGERAALIGAFAACGLAAMAPILLIGRGAAREPIVYYPLLAFPHLAGSSLAWLGEPGSAISLARADFTKALLVVAIGFMALWLAWFATRGKRVASGREALSERQLPSRRLAIALAAIGVFCLLVRVSVQSLGYLRSYDTGGPLGPWTEWVTAGGAALDVALAFAAMRAFGAADRTRTRPDLVLLIVLVILEVSFFGLLAGGKVMWTLPKLLVVVFIYAQFRGRLPVSWILAFVVAVLLVSPVVQQFRLLSNRAVVDGGAPALVVRSVEETTNDLGASTALSLDTLMRRLRQVENVAVVIRDTPSVFPYARGQDVSDALLLTAIPRVVWPDKPVFDAGRRFPQLYLSQPVESRSTTGPSHFGDLYRNFGIPGVVIGMGLLGMAFAALGRWTDRGGLRTLLIVAFALGVLIRVEDSVPEAILAFGRIMPPIVLAALLLPRAAVARAAT
jgi:hypothetical protein